MQFNYYGSSIKGNVRKDNHDSILIAPEIGLFAVADGCGASSGAKYASRIATNELQSFYSSIHCKEVRGVEPIDWNKFNISSRRDVGRASFRRIVSAIAETSNLLQGSKNYATTLTSVAFLPNGVLLSHCGDSTAFLIRGQSAQKLTVPHKYPNGMICALSERYPEYELHQIVDVRIGDKIVICSDGLTDYLKPGHESEHIAQMFALPDIKMSVDFATYFALHSGGKDNISIVCVQLLP